MATRDVNVKFFRPVDRDRQPWQGAFPAGDVVAKIEAVVDTPEGIVRRTGSRHMIARARMSQDGCAALLSLYTVATTDWPHFARGFDVGPILVEDEGEAEDRALGIAHGSQFVFVECPDACLLVIQGQYGPSPRQLSVYLSHVLGLEAEFVPLVRDDVLDTLEQAGVRRFQTRVERLQSGQVAELGPTAELIGRLARSGTVVNVEIVAKSEADRATLGSEVRQLVQALRVLPNATGLSKARVQLERGADYGGDAFLDLLEGEVVFATSVETDATSRRYLDAESAMAACLEAHRSLEGHLHGRAE